MTIVYGIPNCDAVKKARAWLADHGQGYTFHDFKKQGVPREALALWVQTAGWEKLLNRKGTTWRALNIESRAAAVDAASAQLLMLAHTSVIKRPVVNWGHGITVGFDPQAWASRILMAQSQPVVHQLYSPAIELCETGYVQSTKITMVQ